MGSRAVAGKAVELADFADLRVTTIGRMACSARQFGNFGELRILTIHLATPHQAQPAAILRNTQGVRTKAVGYILSG